MFTGLIREIANVKSFQGEKLTLEAKYRPGIGDSVAVNGACLTVTTLTPEGFTVELSHESQEVLATENYRGGVHIEPAMQLSDRLEGHIVQGHVDCIGEVLRIDKTGRAWDFYLGVPKAQQKFLVPKGSIAIDGVSLTINDKTNEGCRLTLIPHSLENTLLSTYAPGRRVNVETDMFARYLFQLFGAKRPMGWDEVDRMLATY